MNGIATDQLIEQMLPWKLSIAYGGVSYGVRPLRVADLGGLMAANDDAASERFAPVLKVLRDFFDDPKPELSSWPVESLPPILNAIQAYVQEINQKILPPRKAGAARNDAGNDGLELPEFVAAVVEASQGSYKPHEVLALRVDWAFYVLGGRAKLMTRIRAAQDCGRDESGPVADSGLTKRARIVGGPEVLYDVMQQLKSR